MQTYTIITPDERYKLTVKDGLAITSTIPFEHVRLLCESKGWRLVPHIEEKESVITFHGCLYIFTWQGNKLTQILKEEAGVTFEISWKDLPQQLKELL